MGIFQQRPEEPTEWAGLPAEPWEPDPAETLLPRSSTVAGDASTSSTSITIDLTDIPADED